MTVRHEYRFTVHADTALDAERQARSMAAAYFAPHPPMQIKLDISARALMSVAGTVMAIEVDVTAVRA